MPNQPTTKQVLLIEDDPEQVSLYKLYFDSEPALNMTVAETGHLGLEMAARVRPDLILLDLLLTDTWGLEVLKTLKQDAATQEIPVIVFTNLYKIAIDKECRRLGADDYWLKTEVLPRQMIGLIKEKLTV